jgi:MarR family transcriptional regulator, organic hydroperoxide resistance regulator
VHDIATTLSITTGGASKLIDRIEGAGLCRRRPNPDDRRSSLLELTSTGRELLGGASVAMEEELECRFGVLPDRTLQQFSTTLRRLRATGRREQDEADRSA